MCIIVLCSALGSSYGPKGVVTIRNSEMYLLEARKISGKDSGPDDMATCLSEITSMFLTFIEFVRLLPRTRVMLFTCTHSCDSEVDDTKRTLDSNAENVFTTDLVDSLTIDDSTGIPLPMHEGVQKERTICVGGGALKRLINHFARIVDRVAVFEDECVQLCLEIDVLCKAVCALYFSEEEYCLDLCVHVAVEVTGAESSGNDAEDCARSEFLEGGRTSAATFESSSLAASPLWKLVLGGPSPSLGLSPPCPGLYSAMTPRESGSYREYLDQWKVLTLRTVRALCNAGFLFKVMVRNSPTDEWSVVCRH